MSIIELKGSTINKITEACNDCYFYEYKTSMYYINRMELQCGFLYVYAGINVILYDYAYKLKLLF